MELAAGRLNVSEGSLMGRHAVQRGSSNLSALVRQLLFKRLTQISNLLPHRPSGAFCERSDGSDRN